MALDAYSYCPCGTGKKIKFCCPDLLGALQELHRMIEGEQYVAALKHIERLEEKYPDRASLLAGKTQLLRATGKLEEAKKTAERFVEKHSENPIALAELTILTALDEGGRAAMPVFQKAMAVSGDRVFSQVHEAMGVLAQALLAEGEMRAGRAVLQLQLGLAPDDTGALEMLAQLNRSVAVPLLIKEDRPMAECPADAPWKERFDEALSTVPRGQWAEVETKLSALAEEVSDSPVIWQSLATIRGWLADTPGSIEALRRYATLSVPLEDGVEAEALAMLLSDDPLGDFADVQMLVYPVTDVERLQAALDASPQTVQVAAPPASVGEDDIPPRAVYVLVSRALSETAEELTLDTIPRVLGRALLFGRQTDREARLEVVAVTSENVTSVQDLLVSVAGDALGSEVENETLTRAPASQELLHRPWQLPPDTPRQRLQELIEAQQARTFVDEWPRLKLGVLDGKSPQEAAGEEGYRVRVLAAIIVLEFWSQQAGDRFDFNRLRDHLGLPTLKPIDPEETPIERVPLVRLHRLVIERLSDDAVLNGYRRSIIFGAVEAMPKFAQAITERPKFNGQEEQLRAYGILARTEQDLDKALGHIDAGRKAAETAGQSSASWDMMELTTRLERGDVDEVSRLIDHLQTEHFREPGVAQALAQLLVQIGVIRPDGTPAEPPPQEEAGLVAPDQTTAEPGKLWTPDSQKPAGEKPAIWTPGD